VEVGRLEGAVELPLGLQRVLEELGVGYRLPMNLGIIEFLLVNI
jgi:hypothetical protein